MYCFLLEINVMYGRKGTAKKPITTLCMDSLGSDIKDSSKSLYI